MRRSNRLSLYIKASLIFLAVSVLFYSCKKGETDNLIGISGGNSKPVAGVALVKVNVVGEAFQTVNGSTPGTSVNAATAVQRQVIPFNKDFNLVAELTPVSSNNNHGVQSSAKGADIMQSDLAQGVQYKVAVFDSTGNYVTERNYVHGAEGSTTALNLDGGSKYTFVAYSIGSTTNVPDIVFADSTAKNLNNSSFVVARSNQAMYYKVDLQLIGGQTNSLDIVLKNKFSQITTIIDASAIGNITKLINPRFYPTDYSDKINLQDGSITYVPSNTQPITDYLVSLQGTPVVFPNLGSTIVASTPTQLYNHDSTSVNYLGLDSITVAGIQQKVPNLLIKNVIFTPGAKYNFTVTFTGKP